MARVEVFADRIVIKLSAPERALALRGQDVVLSRDAITSALITADPWVWLRGVRAPGARLSSKLALGTWRATGGKDFAVIRSGRPAVVLDFDVPEGAAEEQGWVGEFDEFSRVIISTAHATELIKALRLEGETAVFTTDQ